MAIITQDGLFYGDRVKKLSQVAQLMYPRYMVAANTVGRLELNYQKVLATVYASLPTKFTEQEFWGHVGEYYTANLLFTYEADGQIWGQWDTPANLMPRHPLKADVLRAIPPPDAFGLWQEMIKKKKEENRPKAVDLTFFVIPAKVSASSQNPAKSSAKVTRGVGVGGGVGETRRDEALAPSPTGSALVVALPLNDGSDFDVTEGLVDEMKALYQAVDVVQEFRGMRGWLLANRTKRKTRLGVAKFYTNWLAKAQDRGGSNHGNTRAEDKISKTRTAITSVLGEIARRDGAVPQERSERSDGESLVRGPQRVLGSGDP